MQIFNILNARRPSFRDVSPLSGVSMLTVSAITVMLGFQFAICYVPMMLGYDTIDLYTNLICMGLGAASLVWFSVFKVVLLFFTGAPDLFASAPATSSSA